MSSVPLSSVTTITPSQPNGLVVGCKNRTETQTMQFDIDHAYYEHLRIKCHQLNLDISEADACILTVVPFGLLEHVQSAETLGLSHAFALLIAPWENVS